jgi:hypothetical protein
MHDSTRTLPRRDPSSPMHPRRRTSAALVAALLVVNATGIAACSSQVGAAGDGGRQASPRTATTIDWGANAADGGYRCLRDTGGASGQCDRAMGLGELPRLTPAADGGYRCLRDTGGASGQCNESMGLLPPAAASPRTATP